MALLGGEGGLLRLGLLLGPLLLPVLSELLEALPEVLEPRHDGGLRPLREVGLRVLGGRLYRGLSGSGRGLRTIDVLVNQVEVILELVLAPLFLFLIRVDADGTEVLREGVSVAAH